MSRTSKPYRHCKWTKNPAEHCDRSPLSTTSRHAFGIWAISVVPDNSPFDYLSHICAHRSWAIAESDIFFRHIWVMFQLMVNYRQVASYWQSSWKGKPFIQWVLLDINNDIATIFIIFDDYFFVIFRFQFLVMWRMPYSSADVSHLQTYMAIFNHAKANWMIYFLSIAWLWCELYLLLYLTSPGSVAHHTRTPLLPSSQPVLPTVQCHLPNGSCPRCHCLRRRQLVSSLSRKLEVQLNLAVFQLAGVLEPCRSCRSW